jgi:hypothetical protein
VHSAIVIALCTLFAAEVAAVAWLATVVANHGFAECYTYVGDEKYTKALVSRRRVEYRFCSFAPARSEEGAASVGVGCYDTG